MMATRSSEGGRPWEPPLEEEEEEAIEKDEDALLLQFFFCSLSLFERGEEEERRSGRANERELLSPTSIRTFFDDPKLSSRSTLSPPSRRDEVGA